MSAPCPTPLPACPSAETERLAAWADPLDTATVPPSAAASLTASQWAEHVRTAWTQVSPRLAVSLARRFPASAAIKLELQQLVAQDAGEQAVQVGGGVLSCGSWFVEICQPAGLQRNHVPGMAVGGCAACHHHLTLLPPP